MYTCECVHTHVVPEVYSVCVTCVLAYSICVSVHPPAYMYIHVMSACIYRYMYVYLKVYILMYSGINDCRTVSVGRLCRNAAVPHGQNALGLAPSVTATSENSL